MKTMNIYKNLIRSKSYFAEITAISCSMYIERICRSNNQMSTNMWPKAPFKHVLYLPNVRTDIVQLPHFPNEENLY